MSIEEAWKEWSNSETGVLSLDPQTIRAIDMEKSLQYRLRAAFVAGWVCGFKEETAQ
jgi:hypothetical protein